MASMNNWLGFSLSPQELPTQSSNQSISGSAEDCYGLSADDSSAAPPPSLPISTHPTFSILQALNPSNNNSNTQDWSIKSSSDLSMIMGSTSNGNGMEVDDQPKLEDFLGGHSSNSYIFPSYANTCENPNSNNNSNSNTNTTNSTIGLSMIKSWLRNQPAPVQQAQGKGEQGCADVAGCVGPASGVSGSQGLSLSMSTAEMSLVAVATGGGESSSSENNNNNNNHNNSNSNQQKNNNNSGINGGLDPQTGAIETVPRKSIDTFGQRTSIYRGVTRHRWTGRYEAHLWDNSCRREGQTRKGRQVYLGGYDKEEKAARAYDLAALKYWGTTTTTNFPISNYEKELEEMKHMTRQEYVASLRRKSSGFSRGASIYRGVTRHHQHGRWQARIGRVAGNKDLYLGTFSTQEEAAEAYDIAAIKFRGLNAVTNFDMSRYDVKSILESSTLPIGGAAKRLKDVSDHAETSIDGRRTEDDNLTSHLTESGISSYGTHPHHGWPTIAFQQSAQPLSIHYPYGQARVWCKQEQESVISAAQSLQDLQQLQLGGGSTHNFFQPMNNLISMDSSDHSTGSNSVMYNGYMMPMGGTMVVDQGQSSSHYGENEGKQLGYESMFAGSTADPYGGRNVYYLSQQCSSGDGTVKESGYEQPANGCNNWIQSSVQAIAPRSASNVTVCHGAPLFTVWNDA